MTRRFPWFEILLSIVFLGIQVYAATSEGFNLANYWFIRDDAYYYYKVAQNISEGHGSTLDTIHPTNGYHPLWLLICIPIFALARFNIILPLRVLLIVLSLFSLFTAILLYRMIRRALSPPVGMLAAIYWSFNYFAQSTYYQTGLESGVALLFIVVLLYELLKLEKNWRDQPPDLKQIAWFGTIAVLVTFGRLDSIFFCLIIGIWIIFRASPIRYFLPLDILGVSSATLIAFVSRLGVLGYYDAISAALIMLIAGLIIKIPVFYFTGLYQPPGNLRPVTILRQLFIAVLVSSTILALITLAGSALQIFPVFSRVILVLDALATFACVLFIRLVVYGFRSPPTQTDAIRPLQEIRSHWKDWTKEAITYYGILGGVLSIYLLWDKVVFGTFSPVSGQIKRWWALPNVDALGGGAKTISAYLMLDPVSDYNAWRPITTLLNDWINNLLGQFWSNQVVLDQILLYVLGILLVLFAVVLRIRRHKAVRALVLTSFIPLAVGSCLQILSYSVTGYVMPKEWYWLTQQILLVVAAALVVDTLFGVLIRKWRNTRLILWGLIVIFGIEAAYGYCRFTYLEMEHGYVSAEPPYLQAAQYLEKFTPPGAIIGMTGGGNVAYFIQGRTIVNMDGLINSYEYFQALENGSGSDYLYRSGMRYIFANPGILDGNPYRGQYTNRLKLIDDTWGGKFLLQFLPKVAK
jgi:hypothetical protein